MSSCIYVPGVKTSPATSPVCDMLSRFFVSTAVCRSRYTKQVGVLFYSLVLLSPFVLSASALADANDGKYLGFKLGDRYSPAAGSVAGKHITGALIYVVDPDTRHQHIGSLSIFVSPDSSIIGSIFGEWYFSNKRSAEQFSNQYFSALETKYSDWKRKTNALSNGDYQLWLDLEQKPPFADYWPSKKQFRVSVALTFAPDSLSRQEWISLIGREVRGQEPTARK